MWQKETSEYLVVIKTLTVNKRQYDSFDMRYQQIEKQAQQNAVYNLSDILQIKLKSINHVFEYWEMECRLQVLLSLYNKRICGRNVKRWASHYSEVITSPMASWITSLVIVYSTVYSGADQWKHQRSASLIFVQGIHRWPVNSPHKRPVTWKMFPFDDVIMILPNDRYR